MSYKLSAASVEKNKKIWSENIVRFQDSHKKRRNIPLEIQPLENRSRIPQNTQIVGRYLYLGSSIKKRKDRVKKIGEEVTSLWGNKLNFPILSKSTVTKKVDSVITKYRNCLKHQQFDWLNEAFDITNINGNWLSNEDKNLYNLQIESKGQVGYSTAKLADIKSIHPSKRIKMNKSSSIPSSMETANKQDVTSDSDNESEEFIEPEEPSTSKRKYCKTKIATKLVYSSKLSTRKAAQVCQQLSQDGIKIETPTQSAIHKSTMREARRFKGELESSLHLQPWSFHFDGKRINGKEYQVLVLKNTVQEIKLEALELNDGKANTIVEGIVPVLDHYNLWGSIKMIVADTTSVNTGTKNGVVVQLQRIFIQKNKLKPQFIGCQQHILDRVLRIVMDDLIGEKKTSPNIEYAFISELEKNYESLKTNFLNGSEKISEEGGWRDDMKFLFHLTRVFQFFEQNDTFPDVKFHKLPNMSNARWSSRAILALLAFILMPNERQLLLGACKFIAHDWADLWFSNQHFNPTDYQKLQNCLKNHKKALTSVKKFWSREPSQIDIPRSNQCAERAIKVFQELHGSCKSIETTNLRLVLSNKTH